MEKVIEETKKVINTKDNTLTPTKVFTFVSYNDIKLKAVCIALVNNYHNEEFNYDDYTYLCYSQTSLFYLHLIHNLENEEYFICDFNQPLVDYCIIPEYDKKLAEVAE